MKWRVLDAETGEEMSAGAGYDFVMYDDGSVVALDVTSYEGAGWQVKVPYIVEFAFRKDEENQWVWEHSVVYD